MEDKITYQKLKNSSVDKFKMAERYYSILSILNDLHLTEREIQLVAFTAIRGNISYVNVREEFCRKFKTSVPTINNMISKMKKFNLFIKENGRVKVNPKIVFNFDNNVILNIYLTHGETK